MTIAESAAWIKREKFVAIIRGSYSREAIDTIAAVLAQNSILSLEITLNTPAALSVIASLRQRYAGALLIGAGTVRTVNQAQQALDSGAQFMVSPNFDRESVALTQRHDVLHLPGVATPSEAQSAFQAGCKMLKLFPADLLGGPAYLKALLAPLDDIEFVPTGGITVENAPTYFKAGAVAIGVGSWLVPAKDWTPDQIASRAQAIRVVCQTV